MGYKKITMSLELIKELSRILGIFQYERNKERNWDWTDNYHHDYEFWRNINKFYELIGETKSIEEPWKNPKKYKKDNKILWEFLNK